MRTMRFATAALAAASFALGARAEVPSGPPTFSDPLSIDNPYHPFVKFRIRVYDQTRGPGDERAIDVFLPETRTFTLEDGTSVECAVLQEYAIEDGEVVEISKNYFAQADDGTVYYFGEVVDDYEDGEVVGHGGSWLVGGPVGDDPAETVAADAPAVFMPADPEVGDVWKPEDLPEFGIEEFVTCVGFEDEVTVPAGTFHDVLEVEERTPSVERKWYAPGVGFIRVVERPGAMALTEVVDAGSAREMRDALDELLDE